MKNVFAFQKVRHDSQFHKFTNTAILNVPDDTLEDERPDQNYIHKVTNSNKFHDFFLYKRDVKLPVEKYYDLYIRHFSR